MRSCRHAPYPVPLRLLPLLLAVLVAAPAAAQPDARALLDGWLRDWRRAAADVDAVVMRERTDWTVDGPRGRTVVEGEATVRYTRGGPPERDVERVRVDGREVAPDRGRRSGRRWQRAFGPAGREVHAPPPLPGPLLAQARPLRVEADRFGGVAAWRVTLDVPTDRTDAWFTRGAQPRLLAMRFEGPRPRGGRIAREVRYTRVGGLDVPAASETTFTARQRRRLREYYVTLSAEARYDRHDVRR